MGIFNLHGRVAVVTGGTAGLGRGMATALARRARIWLFWPEDRIS